MKLKDLGEIDTGLVLFGGPYSNLQATEALLAQVQLRDALAICTGDVVAYCGDPAATIAKIRASGVEVVAGNCERQLAAGAMDCGCGFEEGSTCDRLSAGWYAHADAHVGGDDRAWMAALPDLIVFEQAGRRFAVIHGGLTEISRFLWSTSQDSEFLEEIEEIEKVAGHIDGVIAGHSGIAFIREVGGKLWINAGVIGMPPNDGRPMTQFATLEDGNPVLHNLNYDAQAAHATMVAAGLTQGYQDGLLSGYWPSEDVLPPELRRASVASG